MQDTPLLLGWVTVTFVLAGFVKGVIGMGFPTLGMGLLGLAMSPAKAAALLIIPSLATNLWQMAAGPHLRGLALRLWPMLVGIGVGALAASGVIAGGRSGVVSAALGVALAIYAVSGLARLQPRLPAAAEAWAGPAVGVATGVVTGATGVFAMPAVPYIGALGLGRDALVQALGLSFTVSTLALAGGLVVHGALPLGAAGQSALALAPALAGMVLGGWLRSRIPPGVFRVCFFAGLLVLGVELIVKSLG